MDLIDIYPDFGNTWKLLKIEREGNKRYYTLIGNFRDYFYCGEDRLNELKMNNIISRQITEIEKVNKKVLFYEGDVYKIYLKGIWSKYKIRKALNNNFKNIFEIDIDSPMRYTIDNIKNINKTNYKTLFFDIETTTINGFPNYKNAIEKITVINMYDSFSKEYYCFVLNPDDKKREQEKIDNKNIFYFDDEKEMIQTFIDKVNEEDYDILTAWNISFDLSYIFGRCEVLGINKNELSPYGKTEIKKQMNKQGREDLLIQISGRFVIDLLLRYKRVIFKEISSYSLDYVSKLELDEGESKMKVLDFTKEWKEHLERLIEYSFRDVEILVKLNEKLHLINYLEELRLINNVPNIYYAETAKHLIDMAIFREYGDKLILPSKQNIDRVKIGGGFVKVPKTDVYENVVVFDFVGLYPSLIQTFNLSKDTIVNEKEADFITYENDVKYDEVNRNGFRTCWTLNHIGIIPTILTKFLDTRFKIKNEMKKIDKNNIEYRDMNLRQYALKAPINANYGVNAYPGFRLYEPRVAATITYLGRQLNKYCSEKIEKDFNLKVLYNDTDSFFIKLKEIDNELIKELERKINEVYVVEFVKSYSNKIKNITIKVEKDKIYKKLLLVKKRRYLGILEDGKWVYKGVDLKRSNTPEIIRDILQYFVENLFKEKDVNIILKECWMLLKKENNIDKFKIPLKISKKYTTNLPQKRAADWSNKVLKNNLNEGSKFYGLYVSNQSTDIIGFTDIEELKDINILINRKKYIDILKSKLENLFEEGYHLDFDFDQQKLFQWGIKL